MFDLVAPIQPLSSTSLSTIAASLGITTVNAPTASPETATIAGETPQPTLFQALLAIQTTPAPALPKGSPVVSAPALPIRQLGGKVLPEAAIAVAAGGNLVQPASKVVPAITDDVAALPPSDPAASPPIPDFAIIAAIFAVPKPQQAAPESATPRTRHPQLNQPETQPPLATTPVASAIAIARTAQIELEPQKPAPGASAPFARPAQAVFKPLPQPLVAVTQAAQNDVEPLPAPPTPAPVVTLAAATSPVPFQPAAPRNKATVPASPADQPQTLASVDADEPQVVEAEPEPALQMVQSTAHAIPHHNPVPATRAEPHAERIDFATLVETLSRAREEASPNAVRASVQHADFGRVSLRFERDDAGAMSVAMSSADPGFTRAVTASNDAASTQSQPEPQRGQHSPDTPPSQRDSPRQQPGSRQSQPPRQSVDPQRREEPKPDSGSIFA